MHVRVDFEQTISNAKVKELMKRINEIPGVKYVDYPEDFNMSLIDTFSKHIRRYGKLSPKKDGGIQRKIVKVRWMYKNNKLNQETIDYLKSIDFPFEPQLVQWANRYKEIYEKYGSWYPSRARVDQKDLLTLDRMNSLRRNYSLGRVSKKYETMLKGFGFDFRQIQEVKKTGI